MGGGNLLSKRKGFTLIELLAVIVILAIIALIAVPQVLKILNKARKSAAEDSVYGIVESAENYITNFMLKNTGSIPSEAIKFECNSTACSLKTELTNYNLEDLDSLEYSGKQATSGVVTINGSDITVENLVINGYTCNYPVEGKVSCTKDGTSNTQKSGATFVSATSTDTHKGILYLDPTNLETECNETNSSIGATGTKTGCMKWYVYKEEDGIKYAILDHNTTAKVVWNSNVDGIGGMKEVATALTTDTTGWDSSLNARLITANEVAEITGNTSFDSATSTDSAWFFLDSNSTTQEAKSQGASKYAWLYDYTNDCTSYGCNTADNSSGSGYWTSDAVAGDSARAWYVRASGYLDSDPVRTWGYGIRPVIEISSSLIK